MNKIDVQVPESHAEEIYCFFLKKIGMYVEGFSNKSYDPLRWTKTVRHSTDVLNVYFSKIW